MSITDVDDALANLTLDSPKNTGPDVYKGLSICINSAIHKGNKKSHPTEIQRVALK
jgi:hypothetical protein